MMLSDSLLDLFSNKNVLYAEDEDGIRENIVEVLELFFHNVVAVSDGLEAVYEAVNGNYDLLIFDVCMPNMDGLDAIKQIRETNKKIPIIIISAHTEQEYLWRAIELKITKYLKKPYNQNSFLDALKTVALELFDGTSKVVLHDDYIYDISTKIATKNETKINLTNKESRLLEYFISNANQTITFEHIHNYLWEFETPSKEAIKSILKELRKKLGKDCIKNVYGIGYILEL